jgi:hypothetical protein
VISGRARNDEELININIEAFKEGFIFLYLFSEDFEPHLSRFETIKSSEYRLCDRDSDVNFVHNPLGNGYQDMFGVNPDDLRSKPQDPDNDGEILPPPEKLVGVLGCFLLYHSKGNLIVDHLNSACYDRVSEKEILRRVTSTLAETNCSGDFKGLQVYWSMMLDKKKATEGEIKKKQPQVVLVSLDNEE